MDPPTSNSSTALFLLCSLALPLAIRAMSLAKAVNPPRRDAVRPAMGCALLAEDLLVGAGIALLAGGAGFWLTQPVLISLAAAVCTVFAHAVMVVDYLIRRQTGVRFSWHFLSYLRVLRCFRGSFRQGGVGPGTLLAVLGVYAAGIAVVLWWSVSRWGVPRLDHLAIFAAVLGVVTLVGQRALDPASLAEHEGIWLHLPRQWLSRCVRRKDVISLTGQELLQRTSPQEHFTALDPSRPLYRLTHEYRGERRLELDLRGEQPHVVLLFLESFCASAVGALGNDLGASPEFDRLARDGVLFRNFYANGVQTARAVVSSLFGIPPRFTERPVQSDPGGCPRLIGLPDFFNGRGYHTAYLHNGSLAFEQADAFCRRHGFRELVGEDDLMARFPEAEITGGWGVPDEFLMRYFADWLADHDGCGQPTFSTLFTISNHHPFEVPAGFVTPEFRCPGNPEKQQFLRTFCYSDACLGMLMRLLNERRLERKCVFFILGDTAQPLGEHDNWGVQVGLYEENVRIPLLIHAPGYLRAPAIVNEPSSQLDLLPTCIDLLGGPFAHHAIGTSLLRAAPSRPIWFNNPFGVGSVGQRLDSLKIVCESRTAATHLYDLTDDPGEQNDLARLADSRAAALRSEVLETHAFLQELYRTNRFC